MDVQTLRTEHLTQVWAMPQQGRGHEVHRVGEVVGAPQLRSLDPRSQYWFCGENGTHHEYLKRCKETLELFLYLVQKSSSGSLYSVFNQDL